MAKPLKIYISASTNPYQNLAMEQQLLLNNNDDEPVLLLYTNHPCVVVGRFQNPWNEVNLPLARKRKVDLVRRQSGGGTVYHDLGNLNFCFIHKERNYHSEKNFTIIKNALRYFDLEGHIKDETNLFVGDVKVSGSAFKQKKDCSFHHGTLLVSSELSDLNTFIKKPSYDLELTHGVKSRPRKVANLSSLSPFLDVPSLEESLYKSFADYYQRDFQVTHDYSDFDESYCRSLQDETWLWGETPLFEITLKDKKFRVKKNKILSVDQSETHQWCGEDFHKIYFDQLS